MKKMQSVKQNISIFYLVFSNYCIALQAAVSVYYYLIKYKSKQIVYYYIMSQMTNQKECYINKCITDMDSKDELKEIDI